MSRDLKPQLNRVLVEDAVRAALLEDLGRAGDITSNATIPEDAKAKAVLATRETVFSRACRWQRRPSRPLIPP